MKNGISKENKFTNNKSYTYCRLCSYTWSVQDCPTADTRPLV
jgi:hypothetical protein